MRAIQLDPNASEGAAFVTLGSLYYMVPGWPIAYGDTNKADALLKKALVINPNTIDANYFYGDFLATRPGIDGLIMQEGGRRGTFLPSVWESLTEPSDFLQHLKHNINNQWPCSFEYSNATT
jgi:hypothetical protein